MFGLGLVIVCASLLQVPTADQQRFMEDWKRARAVYEPIRVSNAELLKDGKLAEWTAALVDAVPQDERTAAHAFVLGNTLFDNDPETAYAMHEEAYAKVPDMPAIALEWAIELHRAGNYAAAEPIYKTLLDAAQPKDVSVVAALRAECLLRLGRAQDAVDCWSKVNVAKDHIQIEKAACWVHNEQSPEARRCELIAQVEAGDADAADALILLDLDFARDWWNGGVNERYLSIDLARIAAQFGADSLRTRQTTLLAELMRLRADPMAGNTDAALEVLGAKLAAAKIVGADAELPQSSRIVSYWFDLLLELGAAEAPALLTQHEAALKARAESGDVDALEVLAAMYAATGGAALAALDREGFDRFGDARFAGSLLASKGESLTADDADLKRALELHPSDPRITRFAVEVAVRDQTPLKEALTRHLAAVYTRSFQANELAAGFRLLGQNL